MRKTALDKVPALAAARLRAAQDFPYFASVLWSLVPVPTPDMLPKYGGKIAVDASFRLYYDPDEIEKWTCPQLAVVLIHEISHLLKDHFGRATHLWEREKLEQTFTPKSVKGAINVAQDAEINDDLVGAGMQLPDDPVLPSKLTPPQKDGDFFENYYENMRQKALKDGPQGKSDGSRWGSDPSDDKNKGGKGSKPKGEFGDQKQNCGSGAHGHPEEWELPSNDPEHHAISQAEAEIIRRNTAKEILESSKTQGNIPEDWKRWAHDRLESKVPWQKELSSMIRNALSEAQGKVDYSWKKRNFRVIDRRFILPGLKRPVPDVVFLIDTSGSMSDEALAKALAEIKGVLKGLGSNNHGIRVACVDAAVHTTQKIMKINDVVMKGGGGTDMALGLKFAAALKPKPHIVILVTDGYTGWPDGPIGPRTIICLVETDVTAEQCPSWAKVLKVA